MSNTSNQSPRRLCAMCASPDVCVIAPGEDGEMATDDLNMCLRCAVAVGWPWASEPVAGPGRAGQRR
jgi:hypothetical protein